MKNDKISIVIADDHPVVRQGIKGFLETQDDMMVKAEVSNGEDAVAAVEKLRPDVVIMDLMMPGMDGIEATRRIKSFNTQTRVIILTSFAQDNNVFPAIKAGADGYLLKDTMPSELTSAIRSVHSGKPVLHPDIAQKLMLSFAGHGGAAVIESLTPRETEVLELIACGLSNQEIAERLVISDKTAKTHVSNILHKLNLSHRTQAALYAVNRNQARV